MNGMNSAPSQSPSVWTKLMLLGHGSVGAESDCPREDWCRTPFFLLLAQWNHCALHTPLTFSGGSCELRFPGLSKVSWLWYLLGSSIEQLFHVFRLAGYSQASLPRCPSDSSGEPKIYKPCACECVCMCKEDENKHWPHFGSIPNPCCSVFCSLQVKLGKNADFHAAP